MGISAASVRANENQRRMELLTTALFSPVATTMIASFTWLYDFRVASGR
jgi:hypothetical protein